MWCVPTFRVAYTGLELRGLVDWRQMMLSSVGGKHHRQEVEGLDRAVLVQINETSVLDEALNNVLNADHEGITK